MFYNKFFSSFKWKIKGFFPKLFSIISLLIKRLFFLFELFLFLRLLLKFLNANPQTFIVELIYKYSDIIVFPFKSIFNDIYWPQGFLIETTTIAAMIGYAIGIFVIFKILNLFSKD